MTTTAPRPTSTVSAERRAWAGAILGTMSSAIPAFLTGAIAVQLNDDLGLGATQVGVAMGVSFLVAAVLSAPMGRLAQHIGPQTGLRLGLTVSAGAMLLVAAVADTGTQLITLLAVAGAANALNQPSANLLLATSIPKQRLGLALAAKQSGMPAAALLGGAAVPAIALTIGWRWAFAMGAALALATIFVVPAIDGWSTDDERRASPDLHTRLLAMYAVVGLLGATTAGAMVAFITSGAEHSGLDPGVAGLVLSLGALTGILSRLSQGWQVDRAGILPIKRLIVLYVGGAVSLFLLAIDQPATYVVITIPAFAFGWSWPGLFNLSVIRNNPSAPGAATGVSQVGVYIGAALGPALGGLIVDASGYRLLWMIGGVSLAIGSGVAILLRRQLLVHHSTTSAGRMSAIPPTSR
jgi:predicted MFS family arabinose efflux permease